MSRIAPFLWFDSEAEAAAELYTSVLPNSRITEVSRYGEGGPGPVGSAMVVAFELDGVPVRAMNGGPAFPHTAAFSFVVDADSQAEIDRVWDALTADGGIPGQCGWLTDRFGLSWQVVPPQLAELLGDPDRERAGRVMQAMLGMAKLDIAALESAAAA